MTPAQTCILIATAWIILMVISAYFDKYQGLSTFLMFLFSAFCLFALVVHLLANVVLLLPRV